MIQIVIIYKLLKFIKSKKNIKIRIPDERYIWDIIGRFFNPFSKTHSFLILIKLLKLHLKIINLHHHLDINGLLDPVWIQQ